MSATTTAGGAARGGAAPCDGAGAGRGRVRSDCVADAVQISGRGALAGDCGSRILLTIQCCRVCICDALGNYWWGREFRREYHARRRDERPLTVITGKWTEVPISFQNRFLKTSCPFQAWLDYPDKDNFGELSFCFRFTTSCLVCLLLGKGKSA